MNNTMLVITGICVGGPALLAACLLAWQRHPVIDPPGPARQARVVDCEDHDEQPSPEEEQMLAQVPPIDPEAAARMRGEIVAAFAAEAALRAGRRADAARLGRACAQAEAALRPGRVRQVDARSVVDSRPATLAELQTPPYHDFERPSPLSADELAAEVAAYEAAAAERFRRAGITWPTNPATVGIARYDDKAGKA